MADSKITDLTEKTSVDGTEEIVLNDSTADRKMSLSTVGDQYALHHGLFTNRYHSSPMFADSYSTSGIGANWLYVVPIRIGLESTATRIGIEVTTLNASDVLLGIYNSDGVGGMPSSVALDAGTVDASTTGEKEITISQTLQPGLYWLALQGESNPALRHGSNADNIGDWMGAATAGANPAAYIRATGETYNGSLPDPFPTSSVVFIATTSYPYIWLRSV